MNQQWWYLSRASGMVAWIALAATCLWGVLLATRVLKPMDRPAWLLDLHRWLGAIAVMGTMLHMATLVADSYVTFTWRELFVPQASGWKRSAVTWGVLGMYVLALVELSSLLMRKLPKRLWHGIHLLSYVLFGFVTVHAALAGTDRTNTAFVAAGGAVVGIVSLAAVGRVIIGRPRGNRPLERRPPREMSSAAR